MRLIIPFIVLTTAACTRPGGVCGGGEAPSSAPAPQFACTSALVGSMVCPMGQVGWGYRCTEAECWSMFMDGPCVSPYIELDAGQPDAGRDAGGPPDDGGTDDAGFCASRCNSPGATQCAAGIELQCQLSCWTPIGSCRGTDAGFFCGVAQGPVIPPRPCTEEYFGANVCFGGAGSGYGYECQDAGCWQFYFDGPCVSRSDAGPGCNVADVCTAGEEGNLSCRGGLRAQCYGGCWIDTGLCQPDAGLLCGTQLGTGATPTEQCTPALAGTRVCSAGPTAGYGYVCTNRGCWDGFLDGPCTTRDAGSDGG